jgi:hypothetical protein
MTVGLQIADVVVTMGAATPARYTQGNATSTGISAIVSEH